MGTNVHKYSTSNKYYCCVLKKSFGGQGKMLEINVTANHNEVINLSKTVEKARKY